MTADARWTHKVVRFKPSTFVRPHPDPDKVADPLNQLGREGRERVHVVEGYGVRSPVFYLKRQA